MQNSTYQSCKNRDESIGLYQKVGEGRVLTILQSSHTTYLQKVIKLLSHHC